MAFKLVEMYAELTLRDTQYRTGLNEVHRLARSTQGQLNALSNAATKAFAAMTAFSLGSIYTFGRFEQEMVRVKIITQATASEFKAMSDAALDLGRKTIFSAYDAAKAMSEFARQGLSVTEILGATPQALNLAATAQIEMSQAAFLVVAAMRGMNIAMTDLPRVTDIMAKAVTSAAFDTALLRDSMKYVGPVAQAMRIPFEDVIASLKVLANNMIRGSEAGTALRAIMLRLQTQTPETAKALGKIGVSVTDNRGKMKGFIQIIEELQKALQGVAEKDRNAVITRIAGLRATTALIALLSTGSDELRRFSRELAMSSGFARQMADALTGTLLGRLELLKSQVENLSIRLGEFLKPTIVAIAAALGSMADALAHLSATVFAGLARFTMFVISGVALAGTVVKLGRFFLALVSPVGLAAAGLFTLAGVMAELIVPGETVAEQINYISTALTAFATSASPAFRTLTEVVLTAYGVMKTTFQNLGAIVNVAVTGILIGIERLKALWTNLFSEILPLAIAVFAQSVSDRFSYISDVVLTVGRWMRDNWVLIIGDLGNAMATMLENMIQNLIGFFKAAKNWIASGFTDAFKFDRKGLMDGFAGWATELPKIAAYHGSLAGEALSAALSKSLAKQSPFEKFLRMELLKGLSEVGNLQGKITAYVAKLFEKAFGPKPAERPQPAQRPQPQPRPGLAPGDRRLDAPKEQSRGTIGIEELSRRIQQAVTENKVVNAINGAAGRAERQRNLIHQAIGKLANGLENVGVGLNVV